MEKNETKNSQRTNKQWAWEFLRRNPQYRDAFKKVRDLNPGQITELRKLQIGIDPWSDEIHYIKDLHIEYLDKSRLIDFKVDFSFIGDYVAHCKALQRSNSEDLPKIYLSQKFKPNSYLLTHWLDCEMDITAEEAEEIWTHQPFTQCGVSTGFTDLTDRLEENTIHKTNDWEITRNNNLIERIDDQRKRKTALKSKIIPIIKGFDGKSFIKTPIVRTNLKDSELCYVFDLSLPIEFQIDSLRKSLKIQQEFLEQSGVIQEIRKETGAAETLTRYIEIIDLLDMNKSIIEIAAHIGEVKCSKRWSRNKDGSGVSLVSETYKPNMNEGKWKSKTTNTRQSINRAILLRDFQYRALAFI